MKKIKIVLILFVVFIMCGCNKNTILDNVELGNYETMSTQVLNYMTESPYVLLMPSISYENGYTEYYKLYKEYDVNYENYKEKNEVASLEINYESSEKTAKIVKVTYIFPKVDATSLTEGSILSMKNLLISVLNGISSNLNTDEVLNKLNYPSDDDIVSLDSKYNNNYYVYLDTQKSQKMNITFDEKNKCFIFTYEA